MIIKYLLIIFVPLILTACQLKTTGQVTLQFSPIYSDIFSGDTSEMNLKPKIARLVGVAFITNKSKKPLELYTENCVHGYDDLEFHFFNKDFTKNITVKKIGGVFFRSLPETILLEPNETYAIPIVLHPQIWNWKDVYNKDEFLEGTFKLKFNGISSVLESKYYSNSSIFGRKPFPN